LESCPIHRFLRLLTDPAGEMIRFELPFHRIRMPATRSGRLARHSSLPATRRTRAGGCSFP
jgi:hypothetical protein